MPPVSPAAYSFLPNSRKLFWPEKPCQPSVPNHDGGSMRPVESEVEQVVWPPDVVHTLGGSLLPGPFAIDLPVQSAFAQYTAPGTRRLVGTEMTSAVFASMLPMLEEPHGGDPAAPQSGEPSAGPPASYTTCVPVLLYRVEYPSTTYQLNSGNISLKP